MSEVICQTREMGFIGKVEIYEIKNKKKKRKIIMGFYSSFWLNYQIEKKVELGFESGD